MKRSVLLVAAAILMSTAAPSIAAPQATSLAEAPPTFYLGQILTVGFGFCPADTMAANGQLLPISKNQSLFALYGTTYGGDGRTTFALPDLRGSAGIGMGQGAGLPPYNLGAKGPPTSPGTGGPASLALNYCVVTNGSYPPRSIAPGPKDHAKH